MSPTVRLRTQIAPLKPEKPGDIPRPSVALRGAGRSVGGRSIGGARLRSTRALRSLRGTPGTFLVGVTILGTMGEPLVEQTRAWLRHVGCCWVRHMKLVNKVQR